MSPRQQSILIGAVVTGVLSTSYLGLINLLCCLGVLLGGAVAVQQYTGQTGTAVKAGDGAVLGAAAGAGGAVLTLLFDRMLRPFGLDSQGMVESMMQSMEGQEGMSPEMMEQFQGGDPSMMMIIGGFLLNVILFSIFGAIGGAIGAQIFGDERTDDGQGGKAVEANIVE